MDACEIEVATPKKVRKPRIIEIDFIRGFCILLMFVDHFFYDAAYIINRVFSIPSNSEFSIFIKCSYNYWNNEYRIVARFIVLAVFFLVSGICSYFSKNNLKRSLILIGVGVLIDLGFLIFSKCTNSSEYVYFGAISCFGVAIFLFWLVKFIYDKCKLPKEDFKWLSLALGAIFVALGFLIGGLKFFPDWKPDLSGDRWLMVVLGKYGYGADWMPLFPYVGYIFIGAFLGEVFYADKKSKFKALPERPSKDENISKKVFYYSLIAPYKGIKIGISFMGHYSIWFYIGHQVINILILCLICFGLGFSFIL